MSAKAATLQRNRFDASCDETGARIRAYLASVRPLDGCGNLYGEVSYQRGRALIEKLALSAVGTDLPKLKLSPLLAADVLYFVHSSEPVHDRSWWRDPPGGPSHLVGFDFVLMAVESTLRAQGARS